MAQPNSNLQQPGLHLHQHQHQQQPWWAGPLQGMDDALQGIQHNVQRFAAGVAQRPTGRSPTRHSSVTLAAAPQPAASARGLGHIGSTADSNTSKQHYLEFTSGGNHSSSKQVSMQQVTKEELGRSTWVFLHTLAAQFPEHPSRQQQKDVRQLIDSLTRIYPCGDCAQHFQDFVKRDPPIVSTGRDFSLWMCRTHNAVNRRLGKPPFNCDLVDARWSPLDCDEHNSCDMTVGKKR